MLGTIVDYLHRALVPFRLASYPSAEARPLAAHRVPPGGILVDARPFVADGRAVLLVFPEGETVDLVAARAMLGGVVAPATNEELPDDLVRLDGPIPPLGQLFGLPLIADEQITKAAIIVFRAFGESVYFEVPFDDYTRLEQPRIASFAAVAELPVATTQRAAHPA
jgi:Ala-tRNA(Pro) deacylase